MLLQANSGDPCDHVTPAPSPQAYREARALARRASSPGDWLTQVLRHHEQIEAAFLAVSRTPDALSRCATQRRLAVLLNGHAIAEEAVLYPALARGGLHEDSRCAYAEQAQTKTRWVELDSLPPMSVAYLDCLEGLRVMVGAHQCHEEGGWFPALKAALPAAEQVMLGQRYHEEFARYVGLGTVS